MTFEAMVNSSLLLLSVSALGLLGLGLNEYKSMHEYKTCSEKLQALFSCIEKTYFNGECKMHYGGELEIRKNYIMCKDAFIKSPYKLIDRKKNNFNEIICKNVEGGIKCGDI